MRVRVRVRAPLPRGGVLPSPNPRPTLTLTRTQPSPSPSPQAHGVHFGDAFPKTSLTAFLQSRLGKELSYEAQKGQERL